MTIVFSATGAGICEQARSLAGVDSVQWPTQKIVNSANNYHDEVVGYAIGADKRFQWDDTNHTKLPEGRAELTQDITDYSFLADEQGNPIITLTGVSVLVNGYYQPLKLVDRNDPSYDPATYGTQTGVPTSYDKIADNIIRLDYKPVATVAYGLKFYFQRAGSYFTASDTTKSPGVAPVLHRGYVIASAYDIALALGLGNLQGLLIERQRERENMVQYFASRNQDEKNVMTTECIQYE